ncbi:MAG: endonuclease/exonuclease/phosphatase [Blastopirellula sp.]|nr:MAG: endonuclease/exonuclease/phosphatase [Blastopirellula sp.]
MRGLLFSTLAFIVGALLAAGCNLEQSIEQLSEQPTSNVLPAQATDQLRVATFNIQVFGQSKMKKPEAMKTIVDVVRRFDVIAIQELRSKEQNVIPQFVQMINAEGANYEAIVGPRLGRSSSKEQYVFLFDASKVEVVPNSVYTVNDPEDALHREPLVATFRARATTTGTPFQFTLINIHTDPDETDWELDALGVVFEVVRDNNPAEDDVIVLGDLNVDYKHLGKLGAISNISWTVQDQMTNTRQNKSYDNIVFDRTRTTEFSGTAGVFNFEAEFGLTREQALEVSDHMPVWAVFSAAESTSSEPVAGRPVPVVR